MHDPDMYDPHLHPYLTAELCAPEFTTLQEAINHYVDTHHVSLPHACQNVVFHTLVFTLIQKRGRTGAKEAARILEHIQDALPHYISLFGMNTAQ